ncbi:MAG: SpoIIE family protein phosphatase [Treponema sp.]|nr:SpoIIE family protein phosphatase [Treponema sp.]
MFKPKKLISLIALALVLAAACLPVFAAEKYYWENPKVITSTDARFPVTVNTDGASYVFWQDVVPSKNQIWLSCRVYTTSSTRYTENLKFAGPFTYSGEVPDIFSVTTGNDKSVLVTVLSDKMQVSAFVSKDNCASFTRTDISSDKIFIAPRVYTCSDGSYRLYTSASQNDVFYIYYSESKDGKSWSAFKQFEPCQGMRNPFVPFQKSVFGGDLVVFQAYYSSSVTNRLSYQLYSTFTSDGGKNWSSPVLLTDQASFPSSEKRDFANFQNQRPYLYYYGGELYVVWERMESVSAAIWSAKLTQNGLVARSAVKVSDKGNSSRASLFEYKGHLYVLWFDTRTGSEAIYMAEKAGNDWESLTLVENSYSNMFANALVIGGQLNFIWQQSNKNSNNLAVLLPDTTVSPPRLTASSFREGKRSRDKNVYIQIGFPDDSSGINGYSYTWGKDNNQTPQARVQNFTNIKTINVQADDDGIYNLLVRVQDKAGNWSEAAKISYHRDLTPPEAPVPNAPTLDKYGFADSNTLAFTWQNSVDVDVAGYNYELTYLGAIPKTLVENKTHRISYSQSRVEQEIQTLYDRYNKELQKEITLRGNIQTSSLKTRTFNNQANGVYRFSVNAIDEVGNVGKARSILIILNKYRPQTFISSASQQLNEIGEPEMEIFGGGFTYEGTISTIYIDRDGVAPYDLVLKKDDGQFKVVSDSKISEVKIGIDLDEGLYKVGLVHTDRGLYMSGQILSILQNGTVKIQPDYIVRNKYKAVTQSVRFTLTIATLLSFLLALFIIACVQAVVVFAVQRRKEKKLISMEIKALISGDAMPSLKNKTKKEKQRSLRGRLVGFTIVLVAIVVLFVTIQNGNNMIATQEETLVTALQNRIDVLMESLSSGVKNFLPTENDLELGSLPSQKDAMAEVKYITILGTKSSSVNEDDGVNALSYVWASNDPAISQKVTNYGEYGIVAGETRIIDEQILDILKRYDGLNARVVQQASDISKQITLFSQENTELALKTDEESNLRRQIVSDTTTKLRNELNSLLTTIAGQNSSSYPAFTNNMMESEVTDYLFYRPVLYRSGNTDNYLHGAIFMEVSVQDLVDQLRAEVRKIYITGALSALAAVILGALGAWLLASLIVKPIKKLETHLVEVGTLMTKSVRERQKLEKKHIDIKSKDEIGRLGDVVNKMTLSAGLAAYEEFLQLDGKAVQERFIPLMDGEGGRKLPVVKLNEDKLDLYAFYKGDSAVSGDYFDYKKLDDSWYVFIKCDISGHGVPAALLVSVVATKFKDFYYFSDWKYNKQGVNLKKFVSAVNDFIFDLGTRGKFSTINISLYNKNTGELNICNAGDNKIHILDGATGQLREITLSNTPTAGGVSTDLVEMTSGGYKVEKLTLKHGDVLYLYTDGIDEAERLVRDENYVVKQTVQEDVRTDPRTGQETKSVQVLDQKEQFGADRVRDVIEAISGRKKYVLTKQENPNQTEVLEFDFSDCEGTIDETIIGLAAVERVFRMVKAPDVRVDDEVEVEKIVDEFLRKHFVLYSKYCMPKPQETEEQAKPSKKRGRKTQEQDAGQNRTDLEKQRALEDPNTTRYAWVTEDKQADDITLIAIRRP